MIKKTTLQNNLQVITDYNPNFKTVTLAYVVKCGSYNETEDILGIAHFTEHMLFKGTVNRTSKEISEAIEGVGGILNAETSFEHTRYYCTIPSEQWEQGLDVLSDLMWYNTLPEEEFEREKQVVLEELKMYDDDPSSKVIDLLFQSLHPNYFNRQYIGGTLETVKKITREQMVQFIDKFYIPSNIVFIATGNVDHDKLVEALSKQTDIDLDNKELIKEKNEFKPDKLGQKDSIVKKDVVQSHLAWGIFGPAPSDKDYITAEIIAGLLGGNSSSRLYQIIREQKGLAYTVSMDIEATSDCSIFLGYVGLDGNNIKATKQVVLDELNKIKTEDIDENELQRIKSYLKGTLMISLEKTSAQNSFITTSIIDKLDMTSEEYVNLIDQVTIEDVKNVANLYFRNDNICFTQVIPTNKLA